METVSIIESVKREKVVSTWQDKSGKRRAQDQVRDEK